MNTQEKEIYEFLRRFPNQFVSVTDISKSVGSRKNFHEDRTWTLPVLRRMELEGWIEANAFGEYRTKASAEETTTFLKALDTPGVPLGDTAIVSMGELKDKAA